MNSLRVWFVGVVCLSLVGWGAAGWAQSTTSNQSSRIIIYPGAADSIAQLQKQGVSKIENYGSYWLAEATGNQLKALQKSLGARIVEASHLNKIELSEASFDVTQGEPAIPGNLQESLGGAKRLRIVQFKGPMLPAWMTQLTAIKDLRVVNYVPNNAYLVSLSANAETALQSLTVSNGPVQWIGAYHPYYKLPKSLRESAGLVNVRVAVLNDEAAAGTVQALRRYSLGGIESHQSALSQWLVTLKVAARDLPVIAQIPSVLWIQSVVPAVKRDELQALVVSGDLSPAIGDSYLSFLLNVGFSISPASYPVLDICDTGVDVGDPYCTPVRALNMWHPAFTTYPTFSVDPSVLACCSSMYTPRSVFSVGDSITDTDGHGTRVASIAVGADGLADELINCYTEGTLIITNIVFPIITNCVLISTTTDAGVINSNYTCSLLTNVTITPICLVDTNNPPPPVSALGPPWFLARQDDLGFQLGLGVSPFGTFGASLMSDAEANPESVVEEVYLATGRISNNSWTEGLSVGINDGAYDSLSQSYDSLTRDALTTGVTNTPGQLPRNQEMLFVFAGGNDNGVAGTGGYGDVLTTPPATAKNVIAVGAAQIDHDFYGIEGNINALSSSSSFGPTRDGRFKPDVVAPGEGVAGAISQASYTHSSCSVDMKCGEGTDPALLVCTLQYDDNSVISELYNIIPQSAVGAPGFQSFPDEQGSLDGVTSYSAPAVSGGAQLLWSYFISPNLLPSQQPEPILPPSPAMMKAYILNSARYLPIISPFTGSADKLPSIGQGMGMLDLGTMFDGESRVIRDESTPRAIDLPLYSTNTVVQQTYFSASGQSYEISGQIADSTHEFRVTLAWTDAPGNPATLVQLVNDLDLVVTVNGQTYYGNDFDTQYSAISPVAVFDKLNNVRSVILPPGASGPFTILVRATNIAGEGVPNVRASLNQDFALVAYNANPLTVSDLPPTVRNPSLPSTNNTCQTAADITTFPYTWVNQLNTNFYARVNPSPTAGRGGIQEFFKIPLPSPGTAFSINTFGSSFDTVLSVWSGGCGSLQEITSNNDSSNTLQSAVTFTADGSDDYYIIAEPHNNALTNGLSGTLVLNVQTSLSPVSISPNPVLFPDQIAGTTGSVHTVTLQNGLTIPLNIQSVVITGVNASAFVILSETCSGTEIAPTNGTCTIGLAFAPSSAGSNQTADLVITDDATGSPQTVPLSGNGLPPAPLVLLTPNELVFSNQPISTPSAPQTITVQNTGSAPLILSNIVILGSDAGDFNINNTTCGALPSSIAPGSSCTLGIDFEPTSNGNRFASIAFTNNASGSPQSVALVGLGCSTITIAPASLPTIVTAAPYSTNLTASGGVAPYTFAAPAGGLPPGLILFPGGVLSGTPTATGSFTFSVTVTDANGCNGQSIYTVIISCGTLTVLPSTLPNVLEGAAYTNVLSVPNGVPPFVFQISSGALPTGINLVNGTLVGAPTAAGAFPFTITATDSNSCSGSQAYTIVVTPTAPALSLSPAQLNFTDQLVGTTSAVQQVTVLNSGTAPLTIDSISFAGGDAGNFVLTSAGCLGTPILPQGTCTIGVAAAPMNLSGLLNTTLQILSNAGSGTNNVPVHGSGIAPVVSLSATVLNFGTNAVNTTTPPQSLVIQNVGNAPLTIISALIGGVNPGDFAITANSCAGGPILPGQECTINVTFKTDTTLQRSATLTIASNATNTPLIVALNGTGQACPLISLTPVALSNAMIGVVFSQAFSAANGVAPYTFSVTAGVLPTGLTLGTNGVLAGTPTVAGGFTFTVQAQDALGCTVSSSYTMTLGCPLIGLTALPSSSATFEAPYQQAISATNGTAPYVFTLATGALPTGLTLSSAGVLSGTPTAVGSFNFTVQAQDANKCVGTQSYLLNIGCPFIGLSPSTLTNLSIGFNFNVTLVATNGNAPYTFSQVSGVLPPGLALTSLGVLSGTPTTGGNFTFTVQASDAHGCLGQQIYTVSVACPVITLLPAALAAEPAGQPFSQLITAANGAGPFSFSVTAGTLPSGVLLSPSGTLSGTAPTIGNFTFTITATDALGCTASQAYTLGVNCPSISLSPGSLTGANVGVAYQQAIVPLSAVNPATFALTSGALPAGLTLSSAGVISGIPTTVGTSTFTLTVTDANGCTASQSYSLSTSCNAFTLTPQTLTDPALGQPYSQSITVAGHAGALNFVITQGSLPPGLSLTSSGSITGTPTLLGSFGFQVTAIDPVTGCLGERFYTLIVGCNTITVSPALGQLPFGEVNAFYSQAFTASGGVGPYLFTQTGGSLPAGMTLSTNGVVSGTPTSGSTVFSFSVKDLSSGCQNHASFTYTLILSNNCPPITVSPGALANGVVGTAYSQTLGSSGGTGPYHFALQNGALPAGMTLSSAGVLTGAPTVGGLFAFTVVGFDGNGCTGFQSYTISIGCDTVAFGPSILTTGIVGQVYSQAFTPTSGLQPLTYAVTGGALPAGLTLDGTGIISGTPTAVGTFAFTLTATDAGQCAGSSVDELVIEPSSDLSIVASVSPNPVTVSNNVTYTVVVANLGPSAASSVTLTDALSPNLTFVSSSSGCGLVSNQLVCDLGSLGSGSSTSVTIIATATTQGNLINTATVTANGFDPNLANNTSVIASTASNVVEFTAAVQVVNASAGGAVVTVTRLGDLTTPVSAQYSTSDGTAVAGSDYVATFGSLVFGAGQVNRTFTVPLLDANVYKIAKTVKLSLTNPSGAALGNQSTATINIIGLASKAPVVFTNAGGDVVTVKLSGAGAMEVSLVGSNTGPISEIMLTNTTATTSLSVSVKRKSGSGQIDIGSIISDGNVKSISAADANVAGAGINVGGGLGSVTLNSLSNSLVTAVVDIKTLKVNQLINSNIKAPQIGSVTIGSVDTNNDHVAFGVTAQSSIGSVKVASPRFTWNRAGANDQSIGDFNVQY